MSIVKTSDIKPRLLIGAVGHARAGKDTAEDYLSNNYVNVWGEAFAAPIKRALSAMYGIPLEHFDDPQFKEVKNDYWGSSPRELAQYFGTEVVRDNLSTRFWIAKMYALLSGLQTDPNVEGEYNEEDVVIITDVRFQNEYEWILSEGGIILHILRPGHEGKVGIPGHSSEVGIKMLLDDATKIHYTINNEGTLEEFHSKIRIFANSIGLQLKEIPKESDSSYINSVRGISLNNL